MVNGEISFCSFSFRAFKNDLRMTRYVAKAESNNVKLAFRNLTDKSYLQRVKKKI